MIPHIFTLLFLYVIEMIQLPRVSMAFYPRFFIFSFSHLDLREMAYCTLAALLAVSFASFSFRPDISNYTISTVMMTKFDDHHLLTRSSLMHSHIRHTSILALFCRFFAQAHRQNSQIAPYRIGT